ncbi:MAG: FKBP-type peptidyl-prolyl cis-trans isomerase [Phycisphaerae bacterium]|nr:FKBP-type peptidyl-prolyl cis-trans isomerase [Phycisphaerae bacterium]
MARLNRTVLAAVVLSFLAARATLAETDYSRMPDPPARIAKMIEQSKVTLAAAIKMAEDATKSRAAGAAFVFNGDKLMITVRLAGADNRSYEVQVDVASGALVDKKEISMYPGDPVTGEPTKTASGLMYYDLKPGTGDAPADKTARVTVHYSGWLVDGKKFDSSVDRGQPVTFALNQVIPGWSEGVGGMKVGGKRKLIIPYDLAYGEGGRPPVIPARAMLIFDVELIAIPK